jgi:8-oxo-dGTP pyrophosphatase MutT (NUDIX family)
LKQTIPRDRGTVIVSNKQGKILFVSKNNIKFVLPGGSVEKDESSFESAIRELREETGLIPKKAQELFKYNI